MAKQRINIGSAANDSTGDPLRTAFTKINDNFTELYANVGSSNYRFSNNTMSTVVGDMNLVPDGTSDVIIGSLSQLNVSATTSSTSTTTGALLVGGGAGIGDSLYVGGGLNTAGALYAGTASFGAINSTIIGNATPSTGNFTTVTATLVNSGNVVSPAMYSSTLATFYETKASYANIGEGTASNLSIVGSNGIIFSENALITNFYSGNVNITGGVISGVGVGYTSIEDTPIGVTIANTAVFTSATTANLATGNAQITGGSINSTKIGNATPSTGAFTTLTASGATTFTDATDSTSSSTGGVVLSGGLGVNGNINAGANVTAAIVSATTNGSGTNFKVGDDAWIGDINLSNALQIMGQQDNTKGYIVFGNGDTATLGRSGTGALMYTGAFTAGDITGVSVKAGSIGNSGTVFTGLIGDNSQPYIQTLGTLTGLTVGGIANVTTVNGSLNGPYNGVVGGITPNVATFTDVTINGNLSAVNFNIIGNVTGTLTGTASSATTAGTATYASTAGLASAATTVVQASQPNITSTGTLVSVFVTGTATVGNLDTFGNVNASGNVAVSGLLTSPYSLLGNLTIYPGNLTVANSYTITNSIGVAGDYKGKIVWDSGNIYVCTADYNGATAIWKRTELVSF
jgi:hypothetical protein